jgi:hypothetical protein
LHHHVKFQKQSHIDSASLSIKEAKSSYQIYITLLIASFSFPESKRFISNPYCIISSLASASSNIVLTAVYNALVALFQTNTGKQDCWCSITFKPILHSKKLHSHIWRIKNKDICKISNIICTWKTMLVIQFIILYNFYHGKLVKNDLLF